MPDVLKVRTVASRLDVSEWTVRRMVKSGHLPHVMVGGSLRIPAAAVDALIEGAH